MISAEGWMMGRSGVRMPTVDELPAGPRRDLLQQLHELYGLAGKPPLQAIVDRSKHSDHHGVATISRDTASKILGGKVSPGWGMLQTLASCLLSLAAFPSAEPSEETLRRLHRSWLTASNVELDRLEPRQRERGLDVAAPMPPLREPPRKLPTPRSARTYLTPAAKERLDLETVLPTQPQSTQPPLQHSLPGTEAGLPLSSAEPHGGSPLERPGGTESTLVSGPLPTRPTSSDEAEVFTRNLAAADPHIQLQALQALEVAILKDAARGAAWQRYSPTLIVDFLKAHSHDPKSVFSEQLPVLVALAARILVRLPQHHMKFKMDNLCLPDLPWSGVSMTAARLTAAVLPCADFTRADLSLAHFDNTRLIKCFFNAANLTEVNFADALLGGCEFDRSRLPSARFLAATITDCSFRDAKVGRATFRDAQLTNVTFDRAVLLGADFRGATLDRASFVGCELTLSKFDGATLSRCDFKDVRGDNFTIPPQLPRIP